MALSQPYVGFDVVAFYRLALEKAPAGAFFFAENGEASFREMTTALSLALNLGEPQPWSAGDAIKEWGYERALYALGSNSRVRSKSSRATLGWAPNHGSVCDWIKSYYQPSR
jgi:hypothetical protein